MRTPAQALLWGTWRLSRWEILLRVAGMSILGCAGYYVLTHGLLVWIADGTMEDPTRAAAGIFLYFAVLLSVQFASWTGGRHYTADPGFPFFLGFARPVSTPLLVGLPMAYLACVSMGVYLIPTTLARILFDAPIPLWNMALAVALATTLFNAIWWSIKHLLLRVLVLSAALAVSGLLVFHRWIIPAVGSDSLAEVNLDFALTAGRALGGFALGVLAFFITTVAVDRQRHGQFVQFRALRNAADSALNGLFARKAAFRSPERALFWFEMRRTGGPVLVASLAASLVYLFIVWTLAQSGQFPPEAAVDLSLVLLAILPIAVTVVSIGQASIPSQRHGHFCMPTFDATRPIGNGKAAALTFATVISTCLLSLALALLFVAVGAELLAGPQALLQELKPIGNEVPLFFWTHGILLLTAYATAAGLLLSGGLAVQFRGGLAWATFLFCFLLVGDVLLAVQDARQHWQLLWFWRLHAWAAALLLATGTAYALHRACASGDLHKRVLIPAVFLWTLFLASAAVLFWHLLRYVPGQVPSCLIAWCLATLLLPLAPFATLPLAIAKLRHQ